MLVAAHRDGCMDIPGPCHHAGVVRPGSAAPKTFGACNPEPERRQSQLSLFSATPHTLFIHNESSHAANTAGAETAISASRNYAADGRPESLLCRRSMPLDNDAVLQ